VKAQFLPGKNIDRQRWDAAVATDDSCLPYGLSWWLDATTNVRWDGIVLDDYRVILPLPIGRSLGRYTQVQRAPFTQQCGPFGQLQAGDVERMLSVLPKTILHFSLPLREQLKITSSRCNRKIFERNNLILPLVKDIASVRKNYSKSIRRQLKKTSSVQLTKVNIDVVIELFRATAGPKAGLKGLHYEAIARLASACIYRKCAFCYRIDDDNHGLLAAGFFPNYRGRIINLFAASTEAGYKLGGMAKLIDALIDRHFQDAHLFDFEGSDIKGIATYFQSFGSQSRPYLFAE